MPKKEFYRITVDGIPYVVEVEPICSGAPQPGPPSTLAPWVLATVSPICHPGKRAR